MLTSAADMKALLGVPATNTTFDSQIQFAAEVASQLVQDYTGRSLVRGTYKEEFHLHNDHFKSDGSRAKISLMEFPVHDVLRLAQGQVIIQTPLNLDVHRAIGVMWLNGVSAGQHISVEYDAGYRPIPADLRAVLLDMVRKQLDSMGVDLSAVGGAAPTSGAPIRAVSVGQLRVEYAISMTSSAAKGTASPVTAGTLDDYQSVLDLYRHPRKMAATPA